MFEYTEAELNDVKMKYYISLNPLKLRNLPVKAKKIFICMIPIINSFEKGKEYTESEVNDIIKEIYPYDHAIIRRYLIDFRLLSRLDNGRRYWVS